MISIKKLKNLSYKTRIRKIILILQLTEQEMDRGQAPDLDYFLSIVELLRQEEKLSGEISYYSDHLLEENNLDSVLLRRILNSIRHALLKVLNAEPAEWDLLIPGTNELDSRLRTLLPIAVYLEEIRSPFNVGAIFRTSEAFGVERIILSPNTPSPLHPRSLKTARGATSVIQWRFEELSFLAKTEGVFALELGGIPIKDFKFPRSGIVLIGSEELGLSPEALKIAKRKAGMVSIPMAGAKRSLNVAVAFGILMHTWFTYLLREEADRSPGEK